MKLWKFARLGGAALVAAALLIIAAPDLASAQTPEAAVIEESAPATPAAAPATPAEEAAPAAATMDKGDVAWMMISTILVLAMIIPGLALFYGGLVRAKNMLSVLMQVSTCAIIGLLVWSFWGYSLTFTDGTIAPAFIGGFDRLFLAGITPDSEAATFSDGIVIPELVFVAFQATFAAITAALVLGSVAERMKFSAVVIFSVLWPLLSYYPIAHMVWYGGGLLFEMGALDFAGGTVVHINAGIAGLVGGVILGHRSGYKSEPWPPHSLTMTYIGAGMLWVGWFGFNAGSNLEATGGAGLALINTLLATAAAAFSWIATEWITKGKPSMLGLASGIVAGLVAITPAAGLVGPMGGIVLGLVASPVAVIFCSAIKNALNYDDSLDVFGIHGVCGIIGAIGAGILYNPAFGGMGGDDYNMASQVGVQATAVALSIAWAAVASIIVFVLLRILGGYRVSRETELEGLDIIEHGERAYHS
ncbi:MAG: ammonium transporter [Hyphomonadaceae bacterium]